MVPPDSPTSSPALKSALEPTVGIVDTRPDALRYRAPWWTRLVRAIKQGGHAVDRALGYRRLPLVGEIDNRIFVDDAEIDDPKIGRSMSVPTALEILVDKERSAPANVGRVVDHVFFRDAPRLLFNVCFSCGKASPLGPGVYADPRSIWFNVFFGYYEIDVDKQAWGRPFGYTSASPDADVAWQDVLRIGKSDWNYFSNYVYGVPDRYIRPCNSLDDPLTKTHRLPKVQVGQRRFDLLHIENAEVVSAYLSKQDGRTLVDKDAVFSPLWRVCFGRPCPRPEFPTSFFPVRMDAKLYMCFREVERDEDLGGPAYQTFLFGGTINRLFPDAAENARFLELQLRAVEKVMTTSYRDVGFAL